MNYEAGLKADWFNKRLLTTLAYFTAEQEGLATFAGINTAGIYYYEGVDVKSEGFEFEATGKINKNTNLVFGVTNIDLTGKDGDDVFTWVPRTTVNFMIDTKIPTNPKLKFGLDGKWQSKIHYYADNSRVKVQQDSYLLLNGFASYELSDKANIRLNVNNLTDEKYIISLYQVAYYAAPRNVAISFGYKF